jgi:hypothetical protein
MAKYYVNKNKQSNGDHEVHKEGCNYMPETNIFSYGKYFKKIDTTHTEFGIDSSTTLYNV